MLLTVSVCVSGQTQPAVDEEHETGCSHGAAGPVPGQEQLSQVANFFVLIFFFKQKDFNLPFSRF